MSKEKFKAVILKNELEDRHHFWINSCEKYGNDLTYRVVDVTKHDWLEEINSEKFDVILARPGGVTSGFKQLYDERIYILGRVFGYNIYPSVDEILIYENKRFLSYWLNANSLPHPRTNVFYFKDEAKSFLKNVTFPIVAKLNIGGSGSGVKILGNYSEAEDYVNSSFSNKGVRRRWGPDLTKGDILKRTFRYFKNFGEIKTKANIYKTKREDIQKNFLILQDYIPHKYEWRIVVIGDSYFAHKKLKVGNMASGTLIKNYDNPPLYLFDFARSIITKFGFYSQAIDLFETDEKSLLINEMQCMFGQSDPYQMLVDGKPGRYLYIENKWVFEEGMFNNNQSYDLRLRHALNLLKLKTGLKN